MNKVEMKSGTMVHSRKFDNAVVCVLRGKYKTHSGGRCQYVFAKDEGRFYAHMN